METSSRFWRGWVLAGSLYVTLGGLFLIVSGVWADLTFHIAAGLAFATRPEHTAGPPTGVARLATAVSGALTLFVGAIVFLLRPLLLANTPQGSLARRAMILATLAWFVLDSAASLMIGAPMNVVGNMTLLLAVWPPLIAINRTQVSAETLSK